ncbi:glutamate carboxypeptidase [Rhodoglobus vestalii]|uniref:Glutamate carboxypeptidase n=1 Tax=Rhodoglobus vestalii TaxID=193384 RepID=A0A8H2K2C1_9MICO|nr:M20 family metallopeptidase [Rhodoglobus vestalii]TQO18810.1 glutamate carboxypeptidase [Rhodoglobus vestalii]
MTESIITVPTTEILLGYARGLNDAFRQDLADLVAIDSGSDDAEGVRAVADWCTERLALQGFSVSAHKTETVGGQSFGPVIIARRLGTGTTRVLLFAHMDTVFDRGDSARRPYIEEAGRAYGPGVSDDKGGIAAAFAVARVLADSGWDGYGELIIALTPDEEVGSPASREILAELASTSDVAFCMECARENGDIVGSRKGVADVHIDVQGRTAHSGVEPERGVNAAVEAAHLLLELQALSGSAPGLSVNVGTIAAGNKVNIVPGSAQLRVEVRAVRITDLIGALDAIDERADRPHVPGAVITTKRLDVCPPLEIDSTRDLARIATRLAVDLGLDLQVAATGGVSDANFVAASGVSTLDGLGPIGGGDHTEDEWIDLTTVPQRVALLSALIVEVSRYDDESWRGAR